MVLILSLITLLVISTPLFGEKAEGKIEVKSEDKAGFELTVKDDLISLNAKDVSLMEIMEEIGNRMKIDLVGNIPEEERISVEFDKLSLKDALEKLSLNYGFLMDTEKEEKTNYDDPSRIAKIIVVPKEKETMVKKSSKREPFKFEFDPSEFMREEE